MRDWGTAPQARKKALRNYPHLIISKSNLQRLIDSISKEDKKIDYEIGAQKNGCLKNGLNESNIDLIFLKN